MELSSLSKETTRRAMFICYTMLYSVASFSVWLPFSGGKDLGTSGAGSVTVVELDQYN